MVQSSAAVLLSCSQVGLYYSYRITFIADLLLLNDVFSFHSVAAIGGAYQGLGGAKPPQFKKNVWTCVELIRKHTFIHYFITFI